MEILGLLVIVAIGVGIFALNNAAGKSLGNKRRCPRCGNSGMNPDGGGYYRNGVRGIDWKCPHCGHSFFG